MDNKCAYVNDVIQVVQLGKYYQLKYLSSLRLGGYEDNIPGFGDFLVPLKLYRYSEKGKNNHKLSNNISRAITTCRYIALSNDWDYFITLTLDPKKYDRFDLQRFHRDLSDFFKFLNRKYSCKIRYLLVPERHKNGAWHIHGLISGLPSDTITYNDNGYYDFQPYHDKFGYCSLSPVVSHVAVSLYITKHLSKQIKCGVIDLNQHLYYCSRGLNRGKLVGVYNARLLPNWFHFQYESEDGLYKSSFFEDNSFLFDLGMIL